jgi:hypothetical protein
VRPLGSLLLALLVAPVAFVLTGRGLGGLAEVASEAPTAEQTDYFAIATSAASVGLAGLLFALLTMARFAPLGPGVAGLCYLAVGIWTLLDRDQLLDTVPGDLVGLDDERLIFSTTVAPLLAVPLLVTLFIPRRWSGRERPEPAPPPAEPWYPPPALETPAFPAPPPIPPPPLPTPAPSRPTSPAPTRPFRVPIPSPPPPTPVPAPPPILVPAPPPILVPAPPAASDEPTDVLPSDEPTQASTSPSDETTTRLNPPPPWPPPN